MWRHIGTFSVCLPTDIVPVDRIIGLSARGAHMCTILQCLRVRSVGHVGWIFFVCFFAASGPHRRLDFVCLWCDGGVDSDSSSRQKQLLPKLKESEISSLYCRLLLYHDGIEPNGSSTNGDRWLLSFKGIRLRLDCALELTGKMENYMPCGMICHVEK